MCLFVRVTGHMVPSEIIGVDLDGDPTCVLVRLIDRAAQALGATKGSVVRIFLDGGHNVNDVSLLEKDDLLYFSFDGGEHGARQSSSLSTSPAIHSLTLRAEWVSGAVRRSVERSEPHGCGGGGSSTADTCQCSISPGFILV